MDLEQLLKDCKKGNKAAQECVFDRFATGMFLVCRRYLKSDEAAEEALLQDLALQGADAVLARLGGEAAGA